MADSFESPFFGSHVPDEDKQEMTRRIDHHQMALTAHAHELFSLFETSDETTLIAVRDLLAEIISGGPGTAHFYQGIVVARLSNRFDLCPTCRVNHDKELNDELGFGNATQ